MQTNNRTAIIRSYKNSYAKNHNPHAGAFLESVLGNNPDWVNGQDDGEATKPSKIYSSVGLTEDQLILESIKNPNHIY
jgi:hypothetical protein